MMQLRETGRDERHEEGEGGAVERVECPRGALDPPPEEEPGSQREENDQEK